jgi:hypothetical protein
MKRTASDIARLSITQAKKKIRTVQVEEKDEPLVEFPTLCLDMWNCIVDIGLIGNGCGKKAWTFETLVSFSMTCKFNLKTFLHEKWYGSVAKRIGIKDEKRGDLDMQLRYREMFCKDKIDGRYLRPTLKWCYKVHSYCMSCKCMVEDCADPDDHVKTGFFVKLRLKNAKELKAEQLKTKVYENFETRVATLTKAFRSTPAYRYYRLPPQPAPLGSALNAIEIFSSSSSSNSDF